MPAITVSMPPALLLPSALREALWAHARREAPGECVGALGGQQGERGWQAQALYPLRNIAPDPQRQYLADPPGLIQALRAMRQSGQQLVAFYHSHPHGPAWPSPTDIAQASYAVPYLIADVTAGELKAFLLPSVEAVSLEEE